MLGFWSGRQARREQHSHGNARAGHGSRGSPLTCAPPLAQALLLHRRRLLLHLLGAAAERTLRAAAAAPAR